MAGTRRLCSGVLVDRRRALCDRRRQIARRIRQTHAAERSFFYGVDFELGCNARYWGTDPPSGEIRPIIGGRLGPVDPILGTSFQGLGALDFAPESRVAYQFPKLGQRCWNTMPITVASTSLSLWAGSSSFSSRSSTIRALHYTSNWGSATASRRLQTVWCSNRSYRTIL